MKLDDPFLLVQVEYTIALPNGGSPAPAVFAQSPQSQQFSFLRYNKRTWPGAGENLRNQGNQMNGLGTNHSSSAIGTLTKSWGNGAPVTRSDLQLLRTAIRQGWPMPPEVLADALKTLRGIVNDGNASDRLINGAVQTLILMDQFGNAPTKSQRASTS